MSIEAIIRPFESPGVSPTPFIKPGQQSEPLVHVQVGLKGGTKTFATSGSASRSTLMGNRHTETPPNSGSLKDALAASPFGGEGS